MTLEQIEYLWELAGRDGDQEDLIARFPEIDWAAAEERREALHAAARAQRLAAPPSLISLDKVTEALKEAFGPDRLSDHLLADSPLLGRMRR